MEPAALVDAAERDVARASRLLRANRGLPGLSRAFFDRVLRLYGEDQGQLAKAGPLAREIVRYGDDAALGYRALAIAERARGRWLASARAFILAGDAATNERDRYAFKTGAIDSLARAGRVDEAIALGHELRHGLAELGEPGLAARAALNAGCALMTQDRYAEAWSTLEGVAAVLTEHGFLAEAASTHLELSTSHLYGGNLTVARAEAETAVRVAEAAGAPYVGAVAEGNLAYVEILRGDADFALQRLRPLKAAFEDAPVDLARILHYTGDALARLNLWAEAADAYREVLNLGVGLEPLRRADLRFAMGRAQIAVGDVENGVREFATASSQYGRLGNHAWRAAAEAARAAATQDARRARTAVEAARRAASPEHLATALLTLAALEPRPETLDEAERLVRQRGIRHLRWRVHALRARSAGPGEALRHYRRMFRAILAERALTTSYASRAAYLRDKTGEIRRYLGLLLAQATPPSLREAVSVVERSRAVALLDEMLGADAPDLAPEVLARLQELRDRLGVASEGTEPGQRRRPEGTTDLARVQRAWLEETHAVLEVPTARARSHADSAICVEVEEGFAVIRGGRVHRLDTEPSTLDRRLRWLHYDLLAPLAQPAASPKQALEGLRELGEAVVRPWLGAGGEAGVCPDGALWRLPWLACADALEMGSDLEVRLHPGMRGKMRRIEGELVVWLAEHPDLPAAGPEAAAILAEFPTARICRTRAEAWESLRGPNLGALHVIAHARLRWDNPMLSSVDFPDGPIHAAEIARARARIGLVTLAACDTGRLSNVNQDEPEGLVRAFLARGAGYVVGSAWTLDDAAASKMYAGIYRNLNMGDTLWSSLRSAQASVRAWRPHPYFWASPVVYGGYVA